MAYHPMSHGRAPLNFVSRSEVPPIPSSVEVDVYKRFDALLNALTTAKPEDSARKIVANSVIALLRKGQNAQLFITGASASRTCLGNESISLSVLLQPGQERQWFAKAAEQLMTLLSSDSDIVERPCELVPSHYTTNQILASGSAVLFAKPDGAMAAGARDSYSSVKTSASTISAARSPISSGQFASDITAEPEVQDAGKSAAEVSKIVLTDLSLSLSPLKGLRCVLNGIPVCFASHALTELCYVSVLEQMNRAIGKDDLVKRSLLLLRAWCKNDGGVSPMSLQIPAELRSHVQLPQTEFASLSWSCCVTILLWVFFRKGSVLQHPLEVVLAAVVDLSKYDWAATPLTALQLDANPALAHIVDHVQALRRHFATSEASTNPKVSPRVLPEDAVPPLFIRDLFEPHINLLGHVSSHRFLQELQHAYTHICEHVLDERGALQSLPLDQMFAGSWASVADRISSRTPSCSPTYFDVDEAAIAEQINLCSYVSGNTLSEEALISIASQILHDRGSLPVGEVGKLLQEATNNATLPHQLKERFGGLKRLLEAHPDIFLLGANHPFNPHVHLRSSIVDGGTGQPLSNVTLKPVLSKDVSSDAQDADGEGKGARRKQKPKKHLATDGAMASARSTIHSWPPPSAQPWAARGHPAVPQVPQSTSYTHNPATTSPHFAAAPVSPSYMHPMYAAGYGPDVYDGHMDSLYSFSSYKQPATSRMEPHNFSPARSHVVSAPSKPTGMDIGFGFRDVGGLLPHPAGESRRSEVDPVSSAFSTGNVLGLNLPSQFPRPPPGLENRTTQPPMRQNPHDAAFYRSSM